MIVRPLISMKLKTYGCYEYILACGTLVIAAHNSMKPFTPNLDARNYLREVYERDPLIP